MYSHVACDVMKERTLYLLKPSSLIWHLMPYLFLFIFFFAGPGQFTKRLLIISADAKGKDSMILFKIKETAHINSGHVLF